jgi:hypothetical protein
LSSSNTKLRAAMNLFYRGFTFPALARTVVRAVLLVMLILPGVLGAAVFTVINSNSSGPGSLAHAVDDANASTIPGPHLIAFAIPGAGVHKIDLRNTGISLGYSITIDGYTQPGASPNTLSVGDNAVILIQLDGGGPFAQGFSGLHISGDDCVVRGLSFTGFSGPASSDAAISLGASFGVPEGGSHRNRIEGNFIGLAPDGVTLSGNNYGISFGTLGYDNVIGGNTPAARNVIAGNRTGIFSPNGVTIVGNYLGTDASGLKQGYGNNTAIRSSFNGIIGTGEPGTGNVITGNRVGILVDGANAIIRGNLIGPRADGSPSFGSGTGVIVDGSETAVGGLGPGEGNVIAFNDAGVEVLSGSTAILSNLSYGNLIDIDLAGDGPTANDSHDQDTGPNNLQNFPIVVSVSRNATETTVTGGLNSIASTSFTLQFFANGPRSAPGQKLLGTKTLTTNSVGDASFQYVFPVATSPDEFITATATDPNGNTSEFFPADGAVELANISTRGNVGTGDNILIGGFILGPGSGQRSFLIRALGPTLNINGALADPQIEVKASNGTLVGRNDNWRDSQEQQIQATGLAPANNREASLIVQLSGQSYTVQVSGVNGGTGIGTVEIFALGSIPSTSSTTKKLRNISTRGQVGTGDNVLIGGTIVRGNAAERVIVRAIGPDLAGAGVPAPLADPTLELRDAEGSLLAANDDWRTGQEQEIIASGLAPQDNRDSAILATLLPTNYTAIVRGKNDTIGVALVEIYALD